MKRSKLFKIISIMLIILIFFPYTITFAASVTEVGAAIATFGKKYYEALQTAKPENIYTYHPYFENDKFSVWQKYRAIPENGKPKLNVYSVDFNHYTLDCVGWVSFCVYNATGMKYGPVESGAGGYVVPGDGARDTAHFENISGINGSQALPGDVLYSGGHVILCVETGLGIDSNGPQWVDSAKGPYRNSKLSSYKVARVTESAAQAIDPADLNIDPSMMIGGGMGNTNESEFYYNGVPDGKYSVAGNFWEWIVDTLLAVFEFLINLCGYVFRMVFVGWTFIVEEFMNYAVNSMAQEDTVLDVDSTTIEGSGFNFNTEDNITIEKIIFDKVKVFDVNFFEDKD